MKITLELFATLMHLLPEEGERLSRHGMELEVNEDTTLNEVIDRMKIPHEQAHIVLINGNFKCGDDRNIPWFKEGDKVSIWPPVAGG